MKSVVVYVTHKGNTKLVAEAIAEALRAHGAVEVLPVEKAPTFIGPDVDLLVLGGPTEAHGMTPEMTGYLDKVDETSLRGRAVAAFDTRVNWPRILSGSAADGIAKRLGGFGARVIGPVGSFIVNTEPTLQTGELERAGAWAAQVATEVTPVPA